MQPSNLNAIDEAINQIKSGDIDAAYDIIADLLKEDIAHANAWAVLAYLSYDPDSPQNMLYCLRKVLYLNPDSLPAQQYAEQFGLLDNTSNGHSLSIPDFPPPLPLTEEKLFSEEYIKETQQVDPTPEIRGLADSSKIAELQEWLRHFASGQTALITLGMAVSILLAFYLVIAAISQSGKEQDIADVAPIIPSIAATATTKSDNVIIVTATPTPTATITLTPTSAPISYSEMALAIESELSKTAYDWDYDLGVGFIDIETGQTVSINTGTRYHAMSTFKGPLAAYFLWQVEQGVIEMTAEDEAMIGRMLRDSSNDDTTCIFERVGGIEGFNDWLSFIGMERENNFVFKWGDWACNVYTFRYIPEPDYRYNAGDAELGLIGESKLLTCPTKLLPCDKAFDPAELAIFYSKLYRGEILNESNTDRLLTWLEPLQGASIYLGALPPQANANVYIKGGGHPASDEYRVNFIGEAGIIETEFGAYALVVFMQRNPKWPGTEPIAEIARITYEYFTAAHVVYTP